MQKANTEDAILVTLSRFGHETQTISLPQGATVAQALETANVLLDGRQEMFVEGVSAQPADVLEDGDILSIVTPKQAGR